PRQKLVARAGDTALELRVVTLAAEVQDAWPLCTEARERDLVQRSRALAAAEDEQHGAAGRQPETRPRLRDRNRLGPQHGTPDDPELRPAPHRVGEEDPPGEPRGEAVRKPEMRVRLGQGGGDPLAPGGVDHRPGDIPTAAEHDVRLPRGED